MLAGGMLLGTLGWSGSAYIVWKTPLNLHHTMLGLADEVLWVPIKYQTLVDLAALRECRTPH